MKYISRHEHRPQPPTLKKKHFPAHSILFTYSTPGSSRHHYRRQHRITTDHYYADHRSMDLWRPVATGGDYRDYCHWPLLICDYSKHCSHRLPRFCCTHVTNIHMCNTVPQLAIGNRDTKTWISTDQYCICNGACFSLAALVGA
jgi:hypothetical protein